MPYYDYKCLNCEHEFVEFFTSIPKAEEAKANKEIKCSSCESTDVEKQVSRNTGFVLKGSGYYSTDYKKKS
jgi:putative FmdB family regulatory protein